MKLDSKIWYVKFYMWLHNIDKYELPKDICSLRNQLFWTYTIFLVTAPLWLLIATVNKITSADKLRTIHVLLANLVGAFMILGFLTTDTFTTIGITPEMVLGYWEYIWLFGPIGFLLVLSLIVVGFMVPILSVRWAYLKLKPDTYPSENPGLVKKMYNSWKEKYCEKIDWK